MKKLSLILVILIAVLLSGCSSFKTLSGLSEDEAYSYSSASDLSDGKVYVWHDANVDDIKDDLDIECDYDIFFALVTGDINFSGQEIETVSYYPRTIWFSEDEDIYIPTLTSADKLIYVSATEVPSSFTFERFADYGYTLGVANLSADEGGHYYLLYAENDSAEYTYYVDMSSDAASLACFSNITRLYLDKVGNLSVTSLNVSDGGTIIGLTKDASFICEFYTGTYYQDFLLSANIHTFSSFETFTSYNYEFLHSNCIAIEIPDYFVSGYYFINGLGLFRYVADEDLATYNGEAYDANIDWNVPLIIYDENGLLVYDPSLAEEEEEVLEGEITYVEAEVEDEEDAEEEEEGEMDESTLLEEEGDPGDDSVD